MVDFKTFSIPYQDTKSFSKTLMAYMDKDPNLRPFIHEWPDMKAFEGQMQKKSDFAFREILSERLQEQYRRIHDFESEVSEPVHANIAALSRKNTFTVTTGHQLNIFTGPLYFLFKIATVIRLARDLKRQYPLNDFVPVYWMATEDHDFAEINHTFVHNTPIVWEKETRSAAGRVATEDMLATVKRYQNILGLGRHAEELAGIVGKAYLKHSNLADATRALVNSLFGQDGLIIIDGDDVQLKSVFSNIALEDIVGQNSFREVKNTNDRLIENGFRPQVYAREINFFYLNEDYRERIVPTLDGNFEVNNQDIRWSRIELECEINEHPERFSPNVIMRPLYQEVLLPNLAYIGGGAEIVYWLQLKGVFDYYGIQFPLLVPRNSAMVIPQRKMTQWRRLGFGIADLFEKENELKRRFIHYNTQHRLDLGAERADVSEVFRGLKDRIDQIDPTLKASAEAINVRLGHALDNLEKKLLKADKRNYQDAMSKIENIKSRIFPDGALQERRENFAQFYVAHGKTFLNILIQEFNPLDFEFTILEISENS